MLQNQLPGEHAYKYHPVAGLIDQDFGIESIIVEFNQIGEIVLLHMPHLSPSFVLRFVTIEGMLCLGLVL